MAEHGVAILGAGIFAKNSHLPALAKTPTLTLKAVYSRSPASSLSLLDATKQFPAFASPVTAYSDDSPGASLADLLARPDIHTVILSLPILVQPSIIEQAWKAGKHVVSEKPVAKDLAESLRLIELWEAEFKPKGINWIIAEQFPYLPSFNKARELIASGKIGELRTFELSLYAFTQPGSKYFETAWRKVPEYQGGFLLDGGVHYFAGLRHALPASDRLSSVVATSRLIQPHLVPFDTLQGLLRTTSGVVGNFTITFGSESRAPLEYVFRGSKGELRVQFGVGSATARTTFVGHDRVSFKGLEEVDVEEWDLVSDGVASEFEAFGKALVGGIGSVEARLVEERTGPRAARRDVGMIEKALESAAKGVWVDIEQPRLPTPPSTRSDPHHVPKIPPLRELRARLVLPLLPITRASSLAHDSRPVLRKAEARVPKVPDRPHLSARPPPRSHRGASRRPSGGTTGGGIEE